MTDIEALKDEFPIFAAYARDNQALHYLDNAATTHKPQCVVDSISECYALGYGPVARGLYDLAEQATQDYEQAREAVARFIGTSASSIIFTKSATESLNTVAQGAIKALLSQGDEVWVTYAEHHANYLPWMKVCEQKGATLRRLDIDENGKLIWPPASEFENKKVKCLAISLISNVLGCYADVASIVAHANQAGIWTVVDAAQAISIQPIDVHSLAPDFMVFSGHKMFGPTGIGVLYVSPMPSNGKSAPLDLVTPTVLGGGMVDWVGDSIANTEFIDGPQAFEAGSPNLCGALGLASAIAFLERLDRTELYHHVSRLAVDCGHAINTMPGYTVLGDQDNWKAGIVTFTHQSIHPHDIAQICAQNGVAIRAGHHCAQPLMTSLGHAASARVSFSLYNVKQDSDALMRCLASAAEIFEC
ncbi:aminotransferase class V-fold PLP-dependent enzyme [Ningiella sp. W23]|uniref:aminotransferase class V-fold PLP-dependent enzyme n=1 Tax=Ningiella sp. W23 TaxID=3023715 RepID=UPI0037578920